MGNRQKKFFDRERSPWRGLKKHKRGKKKIFFQTPHDGYKKKQNFV
jgi:hypothetical protein